MAAYVFIPARLGSTRLPGKPLIDLCGKPLIQWVFEGCRSSNTASDIFIATDSSEIKRVAEDFGATVVMTSEHHKSGTDRIAEACEIVGCKEDDLIVNVQGDEPMVTGELIDILVRDLMENPEADMATLAYPSANITELMDPNIVKVVLNKMSYALYFSRSPIPFIRNSENGKVTFWKHMGFYGYRYEFLKTFVKLPIGKLENAEKLEQLRALENGFIIHVKEAPFDTLSIDTKEDLEKILKHIPCQDVSSPSTI